MCIAGCGASRACLAARNSALGPTRTQSEWVHRSGKSRARVSVRGGNTLLVLALPAIVTPDHDHEYPVAQGPVGSARLGTSGSRVQIWILVDGLGLELGLGLDRGFEKRVP